MNNQFVEAERERTLLIKEARAEMVQGHITDEQLLIKIRDINDFYSSEVDRIMTERETVVVGMKSDENCGDC